MVPFEIPSRALARKYKEDEKMGIEDLFATVAQSIQNSFLRMVNDAAFLIPGLVYAAILFVLGWAVGTLVGGFIRKLLDSIKFEKYLKAHGLEDALGKVVLTDVIVQIFKYYVWLVFLQAAIAQLNLGTLTWFVASLLHTAPVVLGSVALVVVAALFGEWVREKILELGKEPYLKTLGKMTKYFVIFLAIIVGLDTLEFQTDIIKTVIMLVLGAVAVGFGLAVGIAFGLGGQDTAKDLIKSARNVFHF